MPTAGQYICNVIVKWVRFPRCPLFMTMYKCDYCDAEFLNGKVKSNHVRWHHKDNSKHLEAVRKQLANIITQKYGDIISIDVICEKCSSTFTVTTREKSTKSYRRFCSVKCSNSRTISAAQKLDRSLIAKNSPRVIAAILLKRTRIRRECVGCKIITTNKNYCSIACKQLHCKVDITIKSQYRKAAKFKFDLKSFPDKFDFTLIEKFGWYKPSNRGNNLSGISRDHMLSIHDGFNQNVDPALISHPANCRLLKHSDNKLKGTTSSITLDELKERIATW